jgi:hypothetical protein
MCWLTWKAQLRSRLEQADENATEIGGWMEQANRLTLRSVSRPAPSGLRISDFTTFDRNAVTSVPQNTTPPVQVSLRWKALNFRQRRRQLERRPEGLLEADYARRHR